MLGGSEANRTLKFQLGADVLVYAYQWAVAGSAYFQMLSAVPGLAGAPVPSYATEPVEGP